jgi:hypothetical protein
MESNGDGHRAENEAEDVGTCRREHDLDCDVSTGPQASYLQQITPVAARYYVRRGVANGMRIRV